MGTKALGEGVEKEGLRRGRVLLLVSPRLVLGRCRAPGGKCGPLILPLCLCHLRPRPPRGTERGLWTVRLALRAPRGRRRVPDAARASFIIIFGQVECARNSCFTRLTSEGGYSGNQGDE